MVDAAPTEIGSLHHVREPATAPQAGCAHRVVLKPDVTATVTTVASLPPCRVAPGFQKWIAAHGHGAHGPDVAPSERKWSGTA
jgi:hypothetical protein